MCALPCVEGAQLGGLCVNGWQARLLLCCSVLPTTSERVLFLAPRRRRCSAPPLRPLASHRPSSPRRPAALLPLPSNCRPDGESVPKALHVSPLMDMRSTW